MSTMEKIHPDALRFFAKHYWAAAVFAAMMFIAGFAVATDIYAAIDHGIAISFWIAGTIVLVSCALHAYLHCRKAVLYFSGEEIIYEIGIISHNRQTVPLHMITDTKIFRSFADKILGSAMIEINTSGGSGYEIVAEDFSNRDVERVHAELMAMVRKAPESLPDKLGKPPA